MENTYKIMFNEHLHGTDIRIKYCIIKSLSKGIYDFSFFNKYDEEIYGMVKIEMKQFKDLFNFYTLWNKKTIKNFNKKVILFNRDYYKYEKITGKDKYYDVLYKLNNPYVDREIILYYNSITNRINIVDYKNYSKEKNIKDYIMEPITLPIRVFLYTYFLRFLSIGLGSGIVFIFMSIVIVEFINIFKYLDKMFSNGEDNNEK